jgi:hypothetical protein
MAWCSVKAQGQFYLLPLPLVLDNVSQGLGNSETKIYGLILDWIPSASTQQPHVY